MNNPTESISDQKLDTNDSANAGGGSSDSGNQNQLESATVPDASVSTKS
jgi:hypothetical protein